MCVCKRWRAAQHWRFPKAGPPPVAIDERRNRRASPSRTIIAPPWREDLVFRVAAAAELWRITDPATGRAGKVGVIASVSRPFCSTCDRVRLTADGQLRSCLFAIEETDLRGLLRGGADDTAVEAAWRAAMWGKPAGHGINDPNFVQPPRPMSAIGG